MVYNPVGASRGGNKTSKIGWFLANCKLKQNCEVSSYGNHLKKNHEFTLGLI